MTKFKSILIKVGLVLSLVLVIDFGIILFLNSQGAIDINNKISGIKPLTVFVKEDKIVDTKQLEIDRLKEELLKKTNEIDSQNSKNLELEQTLRNYEKSTKSLEEELHKNEKQNSNFSQLASYYNQMKPKKVAEIFDKTEDKDIIEIINLMEQSRVPKILEYMKTDKIKVITKHFLELQNKQE